MPDEDYIKLYEDYALGYGNGAVPQGRSRSSFDLDRAARRAAAATAAEMGMTHMPREKWSLRQVTK